MKIAYHNPGSIDCWVIVDSLWKPLGNRWEIVGKERETHLIWSVSERDSEQANGCTSVGPLLANCQLATSTVRQTLLTVD